MFRSKGSGCFQLTNFTIALLLESLLYLETGKRWQPSVSFGSISKLESWQISVQTFSRLSFEMSFGIPDNSILLRRLYCSDLAWLFQGWWFANLINLTSHVGKLDLVFKIKFLGFWIYVLPQRMFLLVNC